MSELKGDKKELIFDDVKKDPFEHADKFTKEFNERNNKRNHCKLGDDPNIVRDLLIGWYGISCRVRAIEL